MNTSPNPATTMHLVPRETLVEAAAYLANASPTNHHAQGLASALRGALDVRPAGGDLDVQGAQVVQAYSAGLASGLDLAYRTLRNHHAHYQAHDVDGTDNGAVALTLEAVMKDLVDIWDEHEEGDHE